MYTFAHLWDSSSDEICTWIDWGYKPSLGTSGPGNVRGGNPSCAEAQASQQHGGGRNKALPSCSSPISPLTTASGAFKPPRSDRRILPASKGKIEDAHPSGGNASPGYDSHCLEMTRPANAINSRSEKKHDVVYSQSGILYSSENGKNYNYMWQY